MSYGWKRAEIVGALVNGMFLLSLCLYVLLEAIPRFITPPDLNDHSLYFLIVAGTGIGVNLLGAVILGCLGIEAHQHAPGDHSHDHGHGHHHHGGHSSDEEEDHHSHEEEPTFTSAPYQAKQKHKHGKHGHHNHDHDHHDHNDHDHDHDREHEHEHEHDHSHDDHNLKKKKKRFHCDRNIWAVFLHYVGDVLSSICVLITGLLMHFYPDEVWPKYLDPGSSVIIVGIVFFSTIGLVKECIAVLLQGVPKSVDMSNLRRDLRSVPNVLGVHDLHVWELSDGVSIASVHVDISRQTSFDAVVAAVKSVFHRHGIHSTTVQPEFSSPIDGGDGSCVGCAVECEEDRCCVPDDGKTAVLVDISVPDSQTRSAASYGSINRS